MTQLKLEYKTAAELKKAYLPFIENGGLFVATDNVLAIGTGVKVSLVLPDSTSYDEFDTSVVWSAAKVVVQEKHIPGFAIQITGKHAKAIESKIKQLIQTIK